MVSRVAVILAMMCGWVQCEYIEYAISMRRCVTNMGDGRSSWGIVSMQSCTCLRVLLAALSSLRCLSTLYVVVGIRWFSPTHV